MPILSVHKTSVIFTLERNEIIWKVALISWMIVKETSRNIQYTHSSIDWPPSSKDTTFFAGCYDQNHEHNESSNYIKICRFLDFVLFRLVFVKSCCCCCCYFQRNTRFVQISHFMRRKMNSSMIEFKLSMVTNLIGQQNLGA